MHDHGSGIIIVCGNIKMYPPQNDLGWCCKQRLDSMYGLGGGPGIGSYDVCWKCGNAYNFYPDMECSTPKELERWEKHLAGLPIVHTGRVRDGVSYSVTIEEPVGFDGDEEEFMDQLALED